MHFLEWECIGFDKTFIGFQTQEEAISARGGGGGGGGCSKPKKKQFSANPSNINVSKNEILFDWSLATHYNDVIIGAIASQITSLTIVYSIVCSDAYQRKHQSSASLALVRGIPRTNGQLRGKCFHLMTSPCLHRIVFFCVWRASLVQHIEINCIATGLFAAIISRNISYIYCLPQHRQPILFIMSS